MARVLMFTTMALFVACLVMGYMLKDALVRQASLTAQINAVTDTLLEERAYAEKSEQATVRLERSEAERWGGLLQYERDLSGLRGDDGAGLDAVGPDAALRGLRSCGTGGDCR